MGIYRPRSKYLIIYESLLNQIREANPDTQQYLPSERELKKIYKADRHTIRKALDLLSRDGLIKKEAGKGTLILPKPKKGNERNNPHRTIAFILPKGRYSIDRITEPFNTNLFYLIEKELTPRGYHLTYATVGNDGGIPSTLLDIGISGIIFVSQVPDQSLLDAKRFDIPVVLVNRICDSFPVVLEDRYNGFYQALDYLVQMGHRNILFINGVEGHYTTESCKKAFEDFLFKVNENHITGKILGSYWDFDSGKEVMKDYLRNETCIPTAVCGCNDMVAIGAMEAAKEFKYKVPDDMSFLGFDDTEQCRYAHPKLSTISVNSEMIAKYAIDILFASIAKGNPGPLKVIIPTKLVLRDSIAQAKSPGHRN